MATHNMPAFSSAALKTFPTRRKTKRTTSVLTGEAMDAHLQKQHGSVHEVGLSDLLDALRLRGDLPEKRALIGIEPQDMGWGTLPTTAVAAALPEACGAARRLVHRWQTEKPVDAVA